MERKSGRCVDRDFRELPPPGRQLDYSGLVVSPTAPTTWPGLSANMRHRHDAIPFGCDRCFHDSLGASRLRKEPRPAVAERPRRIAREWESVSAESNGEPPPLT